MALENAIICRLRVNKFITICMEWNYATNLTNTNNMNA